MRRLVALGIGAIFSVLVLSGWGEGKSPLPPPAGPLGRPVLPGPQKKKPVPGAAFPLLSPGPPLLRAPVPLPGPWPGTVLVPGYWQGNRWVPGRLELRGRRP
ncbi:MAG: hypothetical protein MUF69_09675 [Desulfobacterota bacterium]|nr:hypothetical protein [Thermodesulfobacteriota bacterium]